MTDKEQQIFDLFKTRACTKQDVYKKTKEAFKWVDSTLKRMSDEYALKAQELDERVEVEYKSLGDFAAQIKFGGDVLIFHMHSNIFNFEKSNPIWQTSYVKDDPSRSYCGIINIYNFLSDSFKYNRENDLGYLVSRIFVNKDNHFFLQGKKELNALYNDFMHDELDKDKVQNIVEHSILHALQFELLTPAYDKVQLVTVSQMKQLSDNQKLQTGKRLGFRFSFEEKMK